MSPISSEKSRNVLSIVTHAAQSAHAVVAVRKCSLKLLIVWATLRRHSRKFMLDATRSVAQLVIDMS